MVAISITPSTLLTRSYVSTALRVARGITVGVISQSRRFRRTPSPEISDILIRKLAAYCIATIFAV
jgi:hypothetical protein